MPEKSTFSSKYLPVIATGLISLIVGVSGGLILDYLRREPAKLEYEVVASEAFAGQTRNVAIVAMKVYNSGEIEVEDLFCLIAVEDATLVEHRVTGIPASTQSITSTEKTFELQTPFINPGENIAIQLFLSLDSSKLETPDITVRGKGVVGKERSISDEEEEDSFRLPLLIATASATLLPIFLLRVILRRYPHWFFTKKHSDDQRDILAYVYAVNGFHEESESVRSIPRELTYWSESDFLAERCLASGDEDMIRRGMKALEDLMAYASVADTSCLIIHFNIARMAVAIGDMKKAEESTKRAREGNHKVIEKRLRLNESLSQIVF